MEAMDRADAHCFICSSLARLILKENRKKNTRMHDSSTELFFYLFLLIILHIISSTEPVGTMWFTVR